MCYTVIIVALCLWLIPASLSTFLLWRVSEQELLNTAHHSARDVNFSGEQKAKIASEVYLILGLVKQNSVRDR